MPNFKMLTLALSDKYYTILRSIIIGIISFLILLLSFKGHVIYYWDQGFIPYGVYNQLMSILNLWIPQRGLGVLGGTINPFAIFIEIEYITSMFFPAWLSELLTIWVFYYLGGLGTIIFIEQILKFNENKNLLSKITVIIPSILFYYGVPWGWLRGGLFNPIQWPDIVAEGLMPFLFILTYKFFNYLGQGKINFKSLLWIYVVFILLLYNFNVWNLILLLVYVPYVFYLSVNKIKDIRGLLAVSSIIMIITLVIYLSAKPFIFLTNLYTENFVRFNNYTIIYSLNLYKANTNSLTLSSVLLSPSLIFNYDITYYRTFLSYITDLIVFLFLIIPLLYKGKQYLKHYLIFFSIFILIIINLWIGVHSPFFYVIKYAIIKFPVFTIIRYPWVALDFIMPFLLTIFFSHGIYITMTHIRYNNKVTITAAILLILLSISYGFPILAGYGIQTYFPAGPPPYINNIRPYNCISSIINSDQNLSTVLVLPPTYSLYSTKEYLGLDIYYWLLTNKNILDGGYLTSPGSHSLYWAFYFALLDHNKILANNILSILNVKYLILESDALYFSGGTMPSFNITEINESLTLLNLTYVTHYDNITLFKYNNPVGLFYSPDNVIIANESQTLSYLSDSNYSTKDDVIITIYNDIYNLSPNQVSILQSTIHNLHKANIISISQIGREKFYVTVNSSGPFLLVFTQTFSPYWVVYVNGTQLSSQYHYVAYGFANAWLINKSGLLQIKIIMSIQEYVEFLYLKYFSVSLLLLSTFYIILKMIEVRKRNARQL